VTRLCRCNCPSITKVMRVDTGRHNRVNEHPVEDLGTSP